MSTFWEYLLPVVILALMLSYKLVAGIRCYQVSGFRFYLIGYSLWILTILVLALFALIDLKGLGLPPAIIVLGLVLARLPQYLLEARVQKSSPALWNAWAEKAVQARQSSWLDRILLPRSVQNDRTELFERIKKL